MKKDRSKANGSAVLRDPRCSSGVEGLDDILSGGLPRDCFYLIQGDPGSGKTTLALQFLLEGVRCGESVFYVTLSETREELLKVTRSHGWSLESLPLLELSSIEQLLRPEEQTTVFRPSEIDLNKVSKLLIDEVSKRRPARIVFDSLSEFRLLAETALRYRRELLNLKRHFAQTRSTVLLLDDKMDRGMIGTDPHVLSLSHGVIEMEQLSPDYGKSRRRLRVLKLRGVKFREGYHDYTIETGGLRVFPRLVAAEHYTEYAPARAGFQWYQGAGRFIWRRFGSWHHDANSRHRRHGQIHARFAVCQTNGVKGRAGRYSSLLMNRVRSCSLAPRHWGLIWKST